jgi:hypothetical protein
MAESISEGTLKTWQKKVGDTVEADEEVATIETDKVCNRIVTPLMASSPSRPFYGFLPLPPLPFFCRPALEPTSVMVTPVDIFVSSPSRRLMCPSTHQLPER